MKLYLPINGNRRYSELCHQYPDNLGHIIGPSYYQKPRRSISFVADNDAFKYWKEKRPFGETEWMAMLSRIEKSGMSPDWVVVPDSVCDRDGTLRNWEKYAPMVSGYTKAFVLQDGMKIGDVPKADVYFVGGSTEFKWSTAHFWTKHLPRVHIGRVRTRRLGYCEMIGAESCDGSGWLRETVNGSPFKQMEAWLEKCNVQHEFGFAKIP